MTTSIDHDGVSATGVTFDAIFFHVALQDGRVLSIPYTWFPRLIGASPEQLRNYTLTRRGIHWDALDEDVSVEALIHGVPDQTNFARRYWAEHPLHRPNMSALTAIA
jgi:hypothetical protein